MSTDPLAVLDGPKIKAEEPLPFTDEDYAAAAFAAALRRSTDAIKGLGPKLHAVGEAAEHATEKAAMLQLVRCESCEQLYRRDTVGLEEAQGFDQLGHRFPINRLIICADCVDDINRRSDIGRPSRGIPHPLVGSSSSYTPDFRIMPNSQSWPASTSGTVDVSRWITSNQTNPTVAGTTFTIN